MLEFVIQTGGAWAGSGTCTAEHALSQLEKQNAISKNENIDRRWEFATCERIGVRGLNYESLARLFEC